MSKLVVDAIQKSGGAILNIPSVDGTAGQFISSDGAGTLSFTSPPQNTVVPDDSDTLIGSVVSNSARANVYSTGEWSSSGPWTTYYHSWQDANSITQGWNMFMGDGYPNGTSQYMYMNDGENAMTRIKEFAWRNRLGNNYKDYFYYDNETGNYAGVTWRCIPVRNTTGAPITRTFTAYLSSRNADYGGCSIFCYTPDTSVYSTASSGTWTSVFSGGSDTSSAARSGSVTIPANTTILLMTNSSHQYNTTYRFKDSNMPYGLDTFFGTGIQCDMRMLEALSSVRDASAAYTNGQPWRIYPLCAANYGDR
jgi:hypothetical protein